MADLTFATAKSNLGAILDIDVSAGDFPTYVGQWLNQGGARVWEARPWFLRDTDTTLLLIAPYSTGTVAVTNNSTGITFTGATLVSGMAGRKFSIGVGQPWYRIQSVNTGAGTAVLTDAYNEATNATATYSIFQDEYDLPSTAETVLDCEFYSAIYRGNLQRTTEAAMDADLFVNPMTGPPRKWAPVLLQTTATRRLRFSPVPNDAYRVRAHYLKAWTEMTGTNAWALGHNTERAWILASCLEAQRGGDARVVTSDAEVEAAIELAWQKSQAVSPVVIRRSPVGSGRRRALFWINDDNATL